jgi:hypothetical protein
MDRLSNLSVSLDERIAIPYIFFCLRRSVGHIVLEMLRQSEEFVRFLVRLAIFLLGGAALIVGCYGVALLVAAFDRHGSVFGDVVLFASGSALLVLSATVFAIAVKRTFSLRGRKTITNL